MATRHAPAAAALSAQRDSDDGNAGIALLADRRVLFDERGADRLPTADIVNALTAREDRPWVEWHGGRPMTARQLAKLLAPFSIWPGKFPPGGGSPVHGYHREQFQDAWARYVPEGATYPEHRNKAQKSDGNGHFRSGTPESNVPDEKHEKRQKTDTRSDVPDKKGGCGDEGQTEAREPPVEGAFDLSHLDPDDGAEIPPEAPRPQPPREQARRAGGRL